MYVLSLDQRIDRLAALTRTRKIDELDIEADTYPQLLAAFQSLLPLNDLRLLLAGNAVFAWMPTQSQLQVNKLPDAIAILKRVLECDESLTENDVRFLAETFQTQRGKSVVAVSKILHFFAPARFPIWDRRVCKTWGRPASGTAAPKDYVEFREACYQVTGNPSGLAVCRSFRQRLSDAGFDYPMTDMRIIELILFLQDESPR